MKYYNFDTKCIMCGTKGANVEYTESIYDEDLFQYDPCDPHLKRTCTLCGYVWREKTLEDSK